MIAHGRPIPRPWHEPDEKQLLDLWEERCSDEHIAEVMGRSVRSIAIKRQKLGLVSSRVDRATKLEALTDAALMMELERRGFTVLPPERHRWDPDHPSAYTVF